MDENSKKRSRKSKLVPRECLDSDDENIAVMQQEIEETLIQIKNKSILKKLSNSIQLKPLEFSIKVEVEEIDEVKEIDEVNEIDEMDEINVVDDNEPGLHIKIDSVKSLCNPSSPVPKLKKSPNAAHYLIASDVIRNEFDKLSQETKSEADKLIEINVQNYLGKKKIPLDLNPIDEKLQNIFRKKWRNFRFSFPYIRDVPLMYKCYVCNIAWWYLYEFREHVLQHKNILNIDLESNCHECNVIAYQGTLPAFKGIWIDSKCWRCSKTIVAHLFLGNVQTNSYRCRGCMEKFYTCRALSEHESNCSLYRSSIQDTAVTFACNLCPIKTKSNGELLEHMVLSHSVRSDIPVDWHLKICGKCEIPYHLQALHDCPYKPPATSCEFCLQKFKSQLSVLMHLNSTKHFYPCKICGKQLRKQCMELEHLMEHTDNYVPLYKCIYCSDTILFPDLVAVNTHKFSAHRRQIDNKNLGSCYEMVVVPKRLVEKYELIKPLESRKKQKSLPPVVEINFDTACQGLLDCLDQKESKDEETNTVIIGTSNYNVSAETIKDHLEKNAVGIEEKSSESESPENSHQCDTDSIGTDENQNDNELNKPISEELDISCKTKKSSQKRSKNVCRLLKPYSRPVKPKKQKKVFCKPKCFIRNISSTDVKMSDKTQANDKEVSKDSQLSDEIESIREPQTANSDNLDSNLVIKQEKPDDYEFVDIQEQPQRYHEIQIENYLNIKQEIDMDITEDNINSNKTVNREHIQYNALNKAGISDKVIKEEHVYDEINEIECVNIHESEIENMNESDIEQINLQIKEEVDDLSANNLILDQESRPSTSSDIDPSANDASTASDDVDMQALEPEVIVYHSYGKKKYKCKKCTFEGHHHEYKKHLKEDVHKWANMNRRKTRPRNIIEHPNVKYTCTKCNDVYRTFYKYIMHFKKKHEYKSLRCPKCSRQSLNVQAFQSHIHAHIKDNFVSIYLIKNKEKDDDNRHQCKTCSAKVNTANFFDHWESHLEITKDREEWKGYLPEMENKHDLKKMLELLQGLDTASNRGLPDKLRHCHKCQRQFERKNECKRHFIEHLLNDAYRHRHEHGYLKCQICGQGFYTNERYKRHMRDHGSLPLYKCEICDKAFSDSSNFTKHKKVHNLSVLICDICGKKFTGRIYLERHMLMHQKIQPMVCQGCNKVFYSESSYRKHMKRGQIRYKCPSCEVYFNCLREKWDHMWEVHKERKFKADCPICNRSFRKHQDVRKHIRHDHADYKYKYVPNKTPLTEHKKDDPVVCVNETVTSDQS